MNATAADPIITLATRLEEMPLRSSRKYADWSNQDRAESEMASRHAAVWGMLMVEMMDAGVAYVGSPVVELPVDVARQAERKYRAFLVAQVESRQPRRYRSGRLPVARSW